MKEEKNRKQKVPERAETGPEGAETGRKGAENRPGEAAERPGEAPEAESGALTGSESEIGSGEGDLFEPELLREALEAQRRALEAERATFAREKLTARVERTLRDRGLGEEFAPFLTGADEAESLARIDAFEALFQRRLRAELEKRLRSKTPPREPVKQRGYSRESLRQMSAGEINRHWEEIAQTLRK